RRRARRDRRRRGQAWWPRARREERISSTALGKELHRADQARAQRRSVLGIRQMHETGRPQIEGGERDLLGAGLPIADEAIGPEIRNGDLDLVAAGLQELAVLDAIRRLPRDAGGLAVHAHVGELVDFTEVEHDAPALQPLRVDVDRLAIRAGAGEIAKRIALGPGLERSELRAGGSAAPGRERDIPRSVDRCQYLSGDRGNRTRVLARRLAQHDEHRFVRRELERHDGAAVALLERCALDARVVWMPELGLASARAQA